MPPAIPPAPGARSWLAYWPTPRRRRWSSVRTDSVKVEVGRPRHRLQLVEDRFGAEDTTSLVGALLAAREETNGIGTPG